MTKRSLLNETNSSDSSSLLKIEIYLKSYILLLVLFGYIVLDFFGIFKLFIVPKTAIAVGILVFIGINLVYLFVLKRTTRYSLLLVYIALTDIIFFSILIHFWGGIDAPVMALLYLLPVPFFSIMISPWSGYLMTVGGYLAYILLCVLEYSGTLRSYGSTPIALERLIVVPFFLAFCFFSIAFYVGYFTNVLRRDQEALAEANKAIEQHNLTLEERISQRTHDLEKAKVKLEDYSQQLEQAFSEKSMQLEEVKKRLESSLTELKFKYNYENIIGKSLPIQEVFRLLDKVTDFDVSILIQGESGTGKELIAKAIHFNGPRKEKTFIIQNCSAIPETLLESELFGHAKGAFTGAHQERKGLFEEADQGTLFLDEIGDMTPGMQAKLLRAIQEGEIRPVGGERTIKVNVRIISATNKDLKNAVKKEEFREDLYYRLNGVTVNLPPLRERREDILLLMDHFVKDFVEKNSVPGKSFSPEAKALLLSYPWPGNVRELENTIKSAYVIAQDEQIQVEDFRYKPELFFEDSLLPAIFPDRFGNTNKIDLNKEKGFDSIEIKSLKLIEKEAIEHALTTCNGKRKEAAKLLDIPIRTFYDKMKKYGVS